MEWISVNDRLPPYGKDVLAYCINLIGETLEKNERYCAIDGIVQWNDGYATCFRTDRFYGKVTHWMCLPPPPKIDKN